jgi:hypothetical protein
MVANLKTPRVSSQGDASVQKNPKTPRRKKGVDMFYGSSDASDPALVMAEERSFN